MQQSLLTALGEQLRAARLDRGLSQPELAARLGRDRARISELERELIANRWGRDRLTLVVEICEALDLVPMLVPRASVAQIQARLDDERRDVRPEIPVGSAFDELFIDLEDDEADIGSDEIDPGDDGDMDSGTDDEELA